VSADEQQLIGRSYTRARKHPLVIGKLPGAGRLPGGPYTITQIVTMVLAFLGLTITRGLWAVFGLADVLVLIAVPWGLAWALRFGRLDGRDPARALRSLLVYLSMPADGRLAGRPQHGARPRLAVSTCTVHVRSEAALAPRPVAAVNLAALTARTVRAAVPVPAVPAAAPAANPSSGRAAVADAGPRARTGLQALLAELEQQQQLSTAPH